MHLSVRSLRPWDVLLPAGLATIGVAELVALRPSGWAAAAALEVVAALILVWRRAAGLLTATLAALVLLQMPWIGPQLDEAAAPILFCAVCGYTLGRWVRSYRGLWGVAVIAAAFAVDYLLVDERVHGVGDVIFLGTLILPPYVFGRVTRRLADQAEELRDAQEAVRRAAVHAERQRVARELHDVVAHSISAMVVQTDAARELLASDPLRARSVLAGVSDTGRRALSDTGRLLHLLRDPDDELGLGPVPGLAQVPALVEAFRAEGLDVDLNLPTELPALPAGTDVSAYRVVQEGLTNALRYAADHRASVSVTTLRDRLDIRTSNAAGTTDPESVGAGLGLLGLAERVHLLGGTLEHGTRGGRFELDVRLPVGP
ncbi:sensor histidine kinase [Ornithinimicrobium avium]|uniref:histidine kinase n=1 Tax=Ornithinimicrobium avium TaxID=2283195 RepID=A0A345NLY0_9MICO|nr:histidine kinase [Ornithinimicrobium avium]AXH96038.1 hypothetical protein DV701_07770 [Ornithinimicrobium avium]